MGSARSGLILLAMGIQDQPMLPGVREANSLSRSWSARQPAAGSWGIAGIGIWSLLASLAPAAAEPGGTALARALGLPPGRALDSAKGILRMMDSSSSIRIALGLWIHTEVEVHRAWKDGLPEGIVERLSGNEVRDQAALDEWITNGTRGILRSAHLHSDPRLRLLLASGLAVETPWRKPLDDHPVRVESGPWAGRTICGLVCAPGLHSPDAVLVSTTPAGPVTVVQVEGSGD